MADATEQLYALKLVPLAEPNADGVWVNEMLTTRPNFDDVRGDNFVVGIRGPITIGPTDQPSNMSGDIGWWGV